ncbi:MAG: hypothetical protein HUJ96_08645 [Marinilabiliaceae bacterium]|nr:hypothetical protein [Marinilabiliaceae bacterium]
MTELYMAMDDYVRLTPEEFELCVVTYRRHRDRELRTSWEQIRVLALCSMQPHVRNTLIPQDVLPLPWDNDSQRDSQSDDKSRHQLIEELRKMNQERLMAHERKHIDSCQESPEEG